jgi:aspartate 1-decarboxylase
MHLNMLKAKLHRARGSGMEVADEGSCGIDAASQATAGILEFEQVEVYNVTHGERLTPHAIAAPAGSETITLNGAAAHRAARGDRVLVCAYGMYTEAEARAHEPTVMHLDTRASRRVAADGV